LIDYFRLARWLNVLITFIVVFLGGVYAGVQENYLPLIIGALSAAFIAAAGNTINDYFDYEVDKINKPYRPLPSKNVTLENAFYFWFLTSLLGLLLVFFVNMKSFLIAFCTVILLYIYSYLVKNRILIGNLIVSFLCGLTFIYAGICVNKINADVIVPAVFAFLFHFSREIIKDMHDIEADKKRDGKTFAMKYGFNISTVVVGSFFLVLIISTIIPYLYFGFSRYYLYIILFGVDFVILSVYISLLIDKTEKNLARLSSLLKGDILLGLVALLFK